MNSLEEEIARLYNEPIIGASYFNTYGEENIKNLVEKYHRLAGSDVSAMLEMIKGFAKSGDLNSCFVSVGVLHGLGMTRDVEEAYRWAQTQEDPQLFTSHFDIGRSIAEHLGFC
ncbi:MAG: hypothetical protein ACE5G9_03860 [Nitrospinales bacterium]